MDADLDVHTAGLDIWRDVNARNQRKYQRAIDWLNQNGWNQNEDDDPDIWVIRNRYIRHVLLVTENMRKYRDWIFHQ